MVTESDSVKAPLSVLSIFLKKFFSWLVSFNDESWFVAESEQYGLYTVLMGNILTIGNKLIIGW